MALLPKVKLKSIPIFPSNIIGGVGIEATKANGAVTIDMAWNEFATQSVVPSSPTNNVLTFDTATQTYVMIPSSLLGGAVAGIADAPIDGFQYGRQSAAWTRIASSFIQAGTGAVTRTMQDKARDLISAKDFGAVGDGSTDDAAAVAAADAAITARGGGVLFFPAGIYRMSSNVTFANPARLGSGSIIKPDATATVTFNRGIDAGPWRIFDLSAAGRIAGLSDLWVDWFTEHLKNTTTNARLLLQSAYDAATTGAVVRWGTGFWTVDGTAITVSKGQKSLGSGKNSTKLAWSGVTCNGFNVTTTDRADFSGFGFYLADGTLIPTSGAAIAIRTHHSTIEGLTIQGGYGGILCQGTSPTAVISGCHATNLDIEDCVGYGIFVQNAIDIYISSFGMVATSDWYDFTGMSGAFTPGETLTFSGGATCVAGFALTATRWKVFVGTSENPVVGQTVHGGTSGVNATLSAITVPFLNGAIALEDHVEAFIASSGDIVGGTAAVSTGATSYTPGNRPGYCRFTDVFFDSADFGVALNSCVAFKFSNCWFSNRPFHGAYLTSVEDIVFDSCEFINNFKSGAFVEASAIHVRFTSCTFTGNNVSNTSQTGVTFNAGCTDFSVIGCRAGGTLGWGTQSVGIQVNAGASNRYILMGNNVSGNAVVGISDGGTGGSKQVVNNVT
jgi:Pectate lyase superfamily protein/Right handed beta helix region